MIRCWNGVFLERTISTLGWRNIACWVFFLQVVLKVAWFNKAWTQFQPVLPPVAIASFPGRLDFRGRLLWRKVWHVLGATCCREELLQKALTGGTCRRWYGGFRFWYWLCRHFGSRFEMDQMDLLRRRCFWNHVFLVVWNVFSLVTFGFWLLVAFGGFWLPVAFQWVLMALVGMFRFCISQEPSIVGFLGVQCCQLPILFSAEGLNACSDILVQYYFLTWESLVLGVYWGWLSDLLWKFFCSASASENQWKLETCRKPAPPKRQIYFSIFFYTIAVLLVLAGQTLGAHPGLETFNAGSLADWLVAKDDPDKHVGPWRRMVLS